MDQTHLVARTKAPHVMVLRPEAVPVLVERYHEYMTAIDALSPKERYFNGHVSQHPNLEKLKVATSAAFSFYATYAYVLGFPDTSEAFGNFIHAAWCQGMIGSDALFGMVGRLFDAMPIPQDPETFWHRPQVWVERPGSRFMQAPAYFDACTILDEEDRHLGYASPPYRRATACLMWAQKCLNDMEPLTIPRPS